MDCLAEAGYDTIDFSFSGEESTELLQSDDNTEVFKELREHAKEKGLIFNQSHAPFGSSPACFRYTKDTSNRNTRRNLF